MRNDEAAGIVHEALSERFGESISVDPALAGLDELARIAGHAAHRKYLRRPIDSALLRLLCACALSAPSKSDLQQGDILILRDAAKRKIIAENSRTCPGLARLPCF